MALSSHHKHLKKQVFLFNTAILNRLAGTTAHEFIHPPFGHPPDAAKPLPQQGKNDFFYQQC